jgi:threonine aldolase
MAQARPPKPLLKAKPAAKPARQRGRSEGMSDEEIRRLRGGCERALGGHGLRTPTDMLAELASIPLDKLGDDTYGAGGVVGVLEEEVRGLLGKPAAVFMPSGTMAQQIALRIHADRTGRGVVGFHPTSHLELHEDKAYQRLHGLVGRTIGSRSELITRKDLEGIDEPLAALLLELPQREIGGRLPDWADLVAQVHLVRERGTAVHLDGARLWESAPFYGRPPAEIAALFDSVYVSFYKGLGGLTGSVLLGDEQLIREARAWRHRHGGTLFRLWPYAASALAGLRLRLPRMPAYVAHAQAIAAELAKIDGVDVVPDPPQVPMMHIHLRTTAAAALAGLRRLASEERIWTWGGTAATDTPGIRRVELTVGDSTLAFSPSEVARIVRRLLPERRAATR